MRKKTLLLLFVMGWIYGFGQVPKLPTYALTPNAASFIRFGDIPVSLYTGTPDISIPLYTLQSGKLSLPISLSYHSGGVKPDEHPGWVGLGWALQAGGVITRTKHDMIDEYDVPSSSLAQAGYYYKHSLTDENSGWKNTEGDFWLMMTKFGSAYDTEPDEFNFYFEGYSGCFMLDSSGNWQVRCNRPLKVQMNGFVNIPSTGDVNPIAAMSHTITGFTLTTEDGIQYVFGEGAVDFSIDIAHQNSSEWEATAWHLKKIIHPNEDMIEFNYGRGDYITWISSSSFTESYKGKDFYSYVGNGLRYFGNLISPVYLQSILGNNIEVDFNSTSSSELTYSKAVYESILSVDELNQPTPFSYLSGGNCSDLNSQLAKLHWKQLNYIQIKDRESQQIRCIDFKYSSTANQRLTLGEVRIKGQIDYIEEVYKFHYRDMDKLPPYLSHQTDNWGFYNNQDYSGSDPFLNKNANPESLLYGSLSDIVYPTGGKTIFEFEPHQYSKQIPLYGYGPCEPAALSVAGGIRIKKVTTIPDDGHLPIIKEYFYATGYTPEQKGMVSSGILEGHALYIKSGTFQDSNAVFETNSSSSLLPCANSLGYHIGYAEVAEKSSEGGYTINNFTNAEDSDYANEAPSLMSSNDPSNPFTSRAFYRGKLKRQRIYDNQGNLLKDMSITYEPLNQNQTFVRSIFAYTKSIHIDTNDGGDEVVSFFTSSVYKFYTYMLVEKSRKINEYEKGIITPVQTSIEYNYNNLGQPKQKIVNSYIRNEVNQRRTNYSYAWENDEKFKNLFLLSLLEGISEDVNGHPVKTVKNSYALEKDKIPVLSAVDLSNGGTNMQNAYQCLLADKKGNPVWIIQNNNLSTVYLWGYDYSYPVAEIGGANYKQVREKIGFPPEDAPYYQYSIKKSLDSLRRTLPEAKITEYTYIPHLGVTSITNPAGKTTYYNYDQYGRLSLVSDLYGHSVNKYVTTFALSKDSLLNSRNYDSLLNDFMSVQSLNGSSTLQPGETASYWMDLERVPGRAVWSLKGNTEYVELIPGDLCAKLRNKRTDADASGGFVQLCLSFLDKEGKIICTKNKYISLSTPYTIGVERVSSTEEEAYMTVTVNSKDGTAINECLLYVNGIYIDTKNCKDDPHYRTEIGGVCLRAVTIKRDGNRSFYQFVVKTDGLHQGEASLEMGAKELFP